jgi:flagellar motility protein MotE (MotC chaperone)
MNPFVKTVVFGLAGLCVLLLVAGVTIATGLRKSEKFPERLRDFMISPEERNYISQMKARPPEAPPVVETPGLNQEKLLTDLAEIANARYANALVEELRRRKDTLDERERWIESREAELRASRTDLTRLARQLEERRIEIAETERKAASERARFAEAQAAETSRVAAQKDTDRARYGELAKLYELQKNDAWQTLRKLDPKEVARIVDLMDPKKAANLLKLAQQDAEYPMAVALHRELLALDPKASSSDQLKRLGRLYSFMKPEQVLPYLKGIEAKEVAELFKAMAEAGASDKDRSALLAALSKDDERRGRQVADLLQPASAQP